MPRKKSEVSKAQVAAAVSELMDSYNYCEITVDMIAKKVGVSKRTLYAYYPSKDALVACLFENLIKELYDEILKVEKSESQNEAAVCEIFCILNDYTLRNIRYFKLYWILASEDLGFCVPREIAEHIAVWNSAICQLVIRILKQKVSRGFFAQVDPDLIAQGISAANKGVIMQSTRNTTLVGFDMPKSSALQDFMCQLFRSSGALQS